MSDHLDIDDVLARHEKWSDGNDEWCDTCTGIGDFREGNLWPCDAVRLARHLDAARTEAVEREDYVHNLNMSIVDLQHQLDQANNDLALLGNCRPDCPTRTCPEHHKDER